MHFWFHFDSKSLFKFVPPCYSIACSYLSCIENWCLVLNRLTASGDTAMVLLDLNHHLAHHLLELDHTYIACHCPLTNTSNVKP